MRIFFLPLLLTAFLLVSCGQAPSMLLPTSKPPLVSTIQILTPTFTSPPPTKTASTPPPKPTRTATPNLLPPEPTRSPSPASALTLQHGFSFPLDRTLIAYQAGSAPNKILVLVDPVQGAPYEFRFPGNARFATPFLAGLSPDARYFVTFEGGSLETQYDTEHLRASQSDLALHVIDLQSGEVIFTAPLFSPTFPQDLVQVAETIKDEWWFQNHSFEEVVAATQEFLLDNIRRVAWSPDGSLLAFASQNPGPTSDLYFYSLESGTAQIVATDPNHVFRFIWAPDSSALAMVTSLYDRHAREDTTYLLNRDGQLRSSFTSQLWFFREWHDSIYGLLDGQTDSGEYFELKTISAVDGTINMLWEGSYMDIAFTPDLSTFLLSSTMPSAPDPPYPGLFLGMAGEKPGAASLRTLSKVEYWEIAFWGSERFPFAASSADGGTTGVTADGELVKIDNGYWQLAASRDGSYLAGFYRHLPSYIPEILPGLRIFDGDGQLLESQDVHVTCAFWNEASNALAYQVESTLYLWEAASGSTRLISDQLNDTECAFQWVGTTH